MSTYRNDDRSSAGSSFARTFAITLIALISLQPACAKWLGDGGVTGSNVNGESREGNTRMVQFTDGTPTVMQLAYDTGVTTAPESFIVMTDHSMILVPKDPNRSASFGTDQRAAIAAQVGALLPTRLQRAQDTAIRKQV